MIVGKTKADVDKLWNAFWTGGITNPLTVIEQINYLLFIRRLDDIESRNERLASRTAKPLARRIFQEAEQHLRWSNFKQLKPNAMFNVVQQEVFPYIKNLGSTSTSEISTFSKNLADAVFMIQKPSLLSSAVELISGLDLDNADTAGDLYEYLLSKLNTSGINGQFRTPRHVINMMVELIAPLVGDRICDPACGTAGFLLSAQQYILEHSTSPKYIQVDEEGCKHGFIGDRLTDKQRKIFQSDMFYGFDFDASMLRVAAMNMWLHGIEVPNITYADTLSKNFDESNKYDVILANPPFKGSLDYADCSHSLLSEVKTKKTELLFLVLAIRLLDVGGRAAIIVPDGVVFSSSTAHVEVRRMLIEDHQLEGVISMPNGVFKPYAGVSTAVLIFSKGGTTDRVWFYEMEHDGYSLDDKRQPVEDNDIFNILECWKERKNDKFTGARQERMAELRETMSPLKESRLRLYERINELQFENVVADQHREINNELSAKRQELFTLDEEIHVLQREFNQLSRQFWIAKEDIATNNYDLSANRYRQLEQDERYFAKADVTLQRIKRINEASATGTEELESLLR